MSMFRDYYGVSNGKSGVIALLVVIAVVMMVLIGLLVTMY